MSRPSDLPDRELDMRVARHVMGWTYAEIDALWFDNKSGDVVALLGEWEPSTDGRAMLAVLDALKAREWDWNLISTGDRVIAQVHTPGMVYSRRADSAPRAVALSALAAVGGK